MIAASFSQFGSFSDVTFRSSMCCEFTTRPFQEPKLRRGWLAILEMRFALSLSGLPAERPRRSPLNRHSPVDCPIWPGAPARTRGEAAPRLRATISAKGSAAPLVGLGSSSIQYRNPIIVRYTYIRCHQPTMSPSFGTMTPISANGSHLSFLPDHPVCKHRRVASSMARRIPSFDTRPFP